MDWKMIKEMLASASEQKNRQIVTNSNRLIKDIETFDYRGGIKARENMIAKVVAYAYGRLDNAYNIGDNLQINMSSDTKGLNALFDNADDSIIVGEKIFAEPTNYGMDMMSLVHEVWHYAEKRGRLDNGVRVVATKSDMGVDHQDYIVAMEDMVLTNRGLEVDKADSAERARNYLRSKYMLQTGEINAREFAQNTIRTIIADMQSRSNLDGNEYCNLTSLRLAEKRCAEAYANRTETAKRFLTRYNDYYNQLYDSYRFDLTKPLDDGKSMLQHMSDDGLAYVYQVGKVLGEYWLEYTTRGLQYHYDDQFAHQLVASMLSSDDVAVRTEGVRTIYLLNYTTKYEMTDNEKESALQSLKEINHIRMQDGKGVLIEPEAITTKDANTITD